MPKFSRPTAYTGRKSNTDKTGQARFATAAEAAAGNADDLIVSPSTLSGAVDDLLPAASTTVAGKVELATAAEMTTGTSESLVPAVKTIKDYVDGVAIAGSPVADEGVQGIGSISTDAQAVAGTANNPGVTALIVTPSNLAAVFAEPPAIGGTTPAGAAFTTLSASGAFALTGDQVQISEGGTGSTSASNARTALGLAIGSDVQAYDAGLADIAGLAVTDGNIIVADGANWVAESGATARTSLGLAIGSDVQAYDAGLADIAGLAVTDGNFIVGDGANWVAESGATVRTSLGLGSIATQNANSVTISGGSVTGITDITVADGGTGASSLTDHGVLVGSGTDPVTALSVGTNGQLLVGSTGADPVFATVGSTNTSIASTTGAGTLSLDVDESYLQVDSVTIATGDVLALATTPIELVAAPGADKFIQFLGAEFILDYNSVPYTESGDNLGIKFTDAAGVQVSSTIECTGFIDQSADTITSATPASDAIVAASGAINQALVLDNLGNNFGAGNSSLIVKIAYRVITAGL